MENIIYLLIGIGVGYVASLVSVRYFSWRKGTEEAEEKAEPESLIERQAQEKEENLEQVLQLFATQQKVTNDDVEEALGVSDATATNYLQELEQEGRIQQVGATGRGVYYELKK